MIGYQYKTKTLDVDGAEIIGTLWVINVIIQMYKQWANNGINVTIVEQGLRFLLMKIHEQKESCHKIDLKLLGQARKETC
jgi:hypothetical protein